MKKKIKDAEYIIKIYIKLCDKKPLKNCWHRDDYTITKKIKEQKNQVKKKNKTKYITHLIEIAPLDIQIIIKRNNLVKIHLNELDEIILK